MSPPAQATEADLAAERAEFQRLQGLFREQYARVFSDRTHPRTILVVPSLSLDQDSLARIKGAAHYEERLLCLLLLLRFPRARVVYLSSVEIPEAIIDYMLHLLPAAPYRHARARLTTLSCHDGSARPLTEKVLERPRLLRRIEQVLGDPSHAHMTCFNVSELERRLAVRLGVPIYGCDPDLLPLGSKSGGRRLFREAGTPMPDGFEDLRDGADVAEALAELKARDPALRRAVVKLNEGFSGEGNATFRFDGAPEEAGALKRWTREQLPGVVCEAKGLDWRGFEPKLQEMGGVVEAFVEGAEKRSPSAQYRVDPMGVAAPVSTHDQLLGGPTGQVFLGSEFPADPAYRLAIQEEGGKVARLLAERGVLGRFGVDFISVREGETWRHYAIEINLRKGGTTHPFLMLEQLTGGGYERETGLFLTRDGTPRYYYATDNLEAERYRGLTPEDLIDIAVSWDIHFDRAAQKGVVFHLIGAMSEFGKVGAVCIGESPAEARRLYAEAVGAVDRETGG